MYICCLTSVLTTPGGCISTVSLDANVQTAWSCAAIGCCDSWVTKEVTLAHNLSRSFVPSISRWVAAVTPQYLLAPPAQVPAGRSSPRRS